jgi:hypothetical protein
VLIRNVTQDSATFMAGRFTFGALPGALVNAALASTTINALQAFNLGLAQSYQQGFGDPIVRGTFPLYAVYAQDSQTSLARWYGAALTTGESVEAVQNWPARIDAVTGEDVQAAAKKWLDRRRAVTGFLLAQENADDNAQAA